jgi:hypothetical protein
MLPRKLFCREIAQGAQTRFNHGWAQINTGALKPDGSGAGKHEPHESNFATLRLTMGYG